MLRRLGDEIVRVARTLQQGAALAKECEQAKARLSLAAS